MALLEIRLFGALQVVLDGEPVEDLRSEKALALLAYLAVESDRTHRREKLAGLLWPGFTETSARMNLSRALADLRSAIERKQPDVSLFHATKQTIQFTSNDDIWVDVSEFNLLLKSELPSPTSGKPPRGNVSQLEEAVTLYCGPFLESFSLSDSLEFEEWSLLVRERLARQAGEVLFSLAVEYERLDRFDRALEHIYQLLELDPWQERARCQLMRLLALDGRRDKALAEYVKYRQELDRELSTEPSATTQQLYEDLREGIWSPDGRTPQAASDSVLAEKAACPYRGLSAFREQDARFFCGRERFAIVLRQAVEQKRFNAVIGSSGSGKSSVVFADLIPYLENDEGGGWLVARCRLGEDPFNSLRRSIGSLLPVDERESVKEFSVDEWKEDPARFRAAVEDLLDRSSQKDQMVLVIDQFEELYTQCPDPDQRHSFLDLLLRVVGVDGRLNVLITLRADFMGRALAHRPFADVLQDGVLMLGPMSREELRAAIVRPAEIQGAKFEPGLADRILDDVGDEPGNLPLLEFALTLLWEQGRNGLLKHAAYDQLGGVEGALARYAEQVYADLRPEDQDQLPKIMMQLVRPGLGTDDTRRVATRSEIGEENWALTRQLADKRLLVTGVDANGNQTVELAHEVLIWEWSRLQGWLNDQRSFRVWQEGLRTFVSIWEAAERDESILLRGMQLAEAEDWFKSRRDHLSLPEREFILNSIDASGQREAEKKAEREDRLAASRRSRRMSGVLAGVLTIAVLLTVFLAYYYPRQRRQAQEAYSLSLAASAREVLADGDTSTALSLALAANQIEDPPGESQNILMEAAYAPGARWRVIGWSIFKDVRVLGTTLDISPDGEKAVTGFLDGHIILWDLATKQELVRMKGSESGINDVAISPNGSVVLSGDVDGHVGLWDLGTGRENLQLEGHAGSVYTVAISSDGQTGVSGGLGSDGSGELILWDLATGEQIRQFHSNAASVTAAGLNPIGNLLLVATGEYDPCPLYNIGSDKGELTLWNVDSGETLWQRSSQENRLLTLDISPDGTQALTGSCNGDVILWDLEMGSRLRSYTHHRGPVNTVIFTPNGRGAISASLDQSIVLWDLIDGRVRTQLKFDNDNIVDVAISSDGRSALSVSEQGYLILFELVDASVINRFEGFGYIVYDNALLDDGENAISIIGNKIKDGSFEPTSLILWDRTTGEQIKSHQFAAPETYYQAAVSPDGKVAMLAGGAPEILLWDLEKWEAIGYLEGHSEQVTGMAFLSEGSSAVSIGQDGRMILWDVPGKKIVYKMKSPGKALVALAVSPNGQNAVTNSGDKTSNFILWDLEAGEKIGSFERPWYFDEEGSTALAFLPGGRSVLSCDRDGAVIEWNLETGIETRHLGLHGGVCAWVEVSPDGRLAITSSADGTIMIWDLKAGKLVRRFDEQGSISGIAIAQNWETLYYSSPDGTITLLRIDDPSLEELKTRIEENRYLPELSCDERKLYHLEPLCDG
ncbi:MAG: BTAD domain-containing putative transcriptional regulator [Anaerolineales bacterium]